MDGIIGAWEEHDTTPTHATSLLSFLEELGLCAYEYLGMHGDGEEFVFRAYCPDCDSVCLVGDFNAWDQAASPLQKNGNGVWELSLPDGSLQDGQNYKFLLWKNGEGRYCADPFARATETGRKGASLVCKELSYLWRDGGWLEYRKRRFSAECKRSQPLNVYRARLDAWAPQDGAPEGLSVLAERLSVYLVQMGYTHVQIGGPVSEMTLEGNERIGSRCAPDARLGSPRDWMGFVDVMHEAGIGVILELPLFRAGLELLGGQPVGDGRMALLRSDLCFWSKEFHADGVCFLLPDGEGTEESLSVMQALSQWAEEDLPDLLLTCRREGEGFRRYVTDEVLNEKIEALAREAEDGNDPELQRLYRLCLATLPGKKRTAMGRELTLSETASGDRMPWNLLSDASGAETQLFVARLNHFYLQEDALWERDGEEDALLPFSSDGESSLIGYFRCRKDGGRLLILINPTDEEATAPLPACEACEIVFWAGASAPTVPFSKDGVRLAKIPSKSACVLAL